jgi:hypothetical protein
MKTELYKKVFIKSEADLPKEYLRLISHYKDEENVFFRVYEPPYDLTEAEFILRYIDWYLQPIDQPDIKITESKTAGSENAYENLIKTLKRDFSGDVSYLSGVNDGMYCLYHKLVDYGVIKIN